MKLYRDDGPNRAWGDYSREFYEIAEVQAQSDDQEDASVAQESENDSVSVYVCLNGLEWLILVDFFTEKRSLMRPSSFEMR